MSYKVYYKIKKLYTFAGVAAKAGRRVKSEDLCAITNAAMIVHGEHILWTGPEKKLKSELKSIVLKSSVQKFIVKKVQSFSLQNQTVLPGFVECHTHLVHAGDRRHEFELRNQGRSYAEIAAQSGGILNTVSATRKAASAKLLALAQARADRFLQQGVTTLEAKSGYGLSEETELKILSVQRKLKGPRIVSTYLGPHAVPAGRTRAEYLREILQSTLPKIHKRKLADRVDIYVEKGFFDGSDAQAYLQKAKEYGFSLTAHVDQLNSLGSAAELLKFSPDSLDHCVYESNEQIMRLARGSSTIVCLPTSDFYLRMDYPPARALLDSGASVALSTDFNPGTSPTQDLSFVGVLARLQMAMTLPEVFAAYTFNAASALGFNKEGKEGLGALLPGYSADFVCTDGDLEDFFYQVGSHPVRGVAVAGNLKKS